MPEKGKVKWFSNVKGFGFIVKEGEAIQDVFVHYKSIQSEKYKRLRGGDEVTFEMAEGKKGPQASSVVLVKKAVKEGQAEKEKK